MFIKSYGFLCPFPFVYRAKGRTTTSRRTKRGKKRHEGSDHTPPILARFGEREARKRKGGGLGVGNRLNEGASLVSGRTEGGEETKAAKLSLSRLAVRRE